MEIRYPHTSTYSQARLNWIQWNKMSTKKKLGGFNFRDIEGFNVAMSEKQGCKLVANHISLLTCVLEVKYLDGLTMQLCISMIKVSFVPLHLSARPNTGDQQAEMQCRFNNY